LAEITPAAECNWAADFEITKRTRFEGLLPMTSYRQIEANRRNALKSTGPRTEAGKEVSRCNAVTTTQSPLLASMIIETGRYSRADHRLEQIPLAFIHTLRA
jgi:hypothetical protein